MSACKSYPDCYCIIIDDEKYDSFSSKLCDELSNSSRNIPVRSRRVRMSVVGRGEERLIRAVSCALTGSHSGERKMALHESCYITPSADDDAFDSFNGDLAQHIVLVEDEDRGDDVVQSCANILEKIYKEKQHDACPPVIFALVASGKHGLGDAILFAPPEEGKRGNAPWTSLHEVILESFANASSQVRPRARYILEQKYGQSEEEGDKSKVEVVRIHNEDENKLSLFYKSGLKSGAMHFNFSPPSPPLDSDADEEEGEHEMQRTCSIPLVETCTSQEDLAKYLNQHVAGGNNANAIATHLANCFKHAEGAPPVNKLYQRSSSSNTVRDTPVSLSKVNGKLMTKKQKTAHLVSQYVSLT